MTREAELVNVRQELLERGDEMISFRQLVERFDEIEKVYKGIPWTLEQIYTNFNILIGEEPCDDIISRKQAIRKLQKKIDKKAKGDISGFYNTIVQNDIETIKELPSVQPKQGVDSC